PEQDDGWERSGNLDASTSEVPMEPIGSCTPPGLVNVIEVPQAEKAWLLSAEPRTHIIPDLLVCTRDVPNTHLVHVTLEITPTLRKHVSRRAILARVFRSSHNAGTQVIPWII